jgi:LCP family protein required for cell wall assembly
LYAFGSRFNAHGLILGIVLLILVLAAASCGSPGAAQTPVVAAAEDTATPPPTSSHNPIPATDTPSTTPTEIPPTSTPSVTPTPAPACGGPEQILLLTIGTDSRSDSYLYGMADVIRLVRLDFRERELSMLSLPRDMWVEVPGIADHGITHGKLNQSYFWGTAGMGYYESEAEGAGLLALTLEHNFGVRPDHYLTINMKTFKSMVANIGGVYVSVPYTMDGRTDKSLPKEPRYGYFPAGPAYLDATTALQYARIRSMDNDFPRQERQSQILQGIWDRVLSPEIIELVPDLIDFFRGDVLTDLSPQQISQISCLVLSLHEDDMHYAKLEEELFIRFWTITDELALKWDRAEIQPIIDAFLMGERPESEAGS